MTARACDPCFRGDCDKCYGGECACCGTREFASWERDTDEGNVQ